MDLVTIIIPTYNRFDTFLKKAIASATEQTHENLEIIITDDNSTLNRQQQDIYITNLIIKDKRLKYITSDTNTGFVGNLNRGLSNVTGKYVSILFDDDHFLPEYIENAVRILNNDNELAFVQQGAFNNSGNIKTYYHPKYCGKMTIYTYLYYLNPLYHNNSMLWSISPCNYVFRNRNIKFRTTLYPEFTERQLLRGSGYDILYILDNFNGYNYCYHLPSHTVVFTSHSNSITISNIEQVISDTQKGVFQYFNENFQYYKIELNQYLLNEVYFTCTNLIEKVDFFTNIIENYNISIYEIKSIFFSNGIYTLSFDNLKKMINVKNNVDVNALYKNVYDTLVNQKKKIPLLSEVKHYKYANAKTYTQYITGLFGVHLTNEIGVIIKNGIDIEKKIINTDSYKNQFATSSKNIILNYYDDLKKRKIKKIAIIGTANNIKYGRFLKEELFERKYAKTKNDDSWNNLFIKYLNRIYTALEIKNHSTKAFNLFERELYNCEEFSKINGISQTSKIQFNEFKIIKDKLWNYIPIIFNYNDIIALSKLPIKEWDAYIKNINYNIEYYFNTKYNYTYNEIIGDDLLCAIQIGGHLRYYNEVYASFSHLKNIVNYEFFLFIWDDFMGFKYTNGKINEIITNKNNNEMAKAIDDCITKFKPTKYEIDNNNNYLKGNIFCSGIKIIEYDGCSYPSIKSQYYTIYKANRLRLKHEKETKKKYDIVIEQLDSEGKKAFDDFIKQYPSEIINETIKRDIVTEIKQIRFLGN